MGRVRQIAGSDERGLLHFADRAAEAPVIYFDGPLRMGLLPGQVLVRGDKPGELQACVGTRGVGAGTFAALVYTTQPGLIPDGISPHAELEFPAKAAGGTPVRTAVALKGRC